MRLKKSRFSSQAVWRKFGRRVQIWTENFGFGDRHFAGWNYTPTRFWICDFGFIDRKSQIANIWSERRESNPQLPVWKTGTQPFEFRSLMVGGQWSEVSLLSPDHRPRIMHRGRFELPERKPRQFYRLLALSRWRPMRMMSIPRPSGESIVKNKNFCVKMKKAEI